MWMVGIESHMRKGNLNPETFNGSVERVGLERR